MIDIGTRCVTLRCDELLCMTNRVSELTRGADFPL